MLRAHSALPVFGRAVSLASEARTARYLNIALLSVSSLCRWMACIINAPAGVCLGLVAVSIG